MNVENQKKLMDCLRSMSCPYCHRQYDIWLPLKETPTPEGHYGENCCPECLNFLRRVLPLEWTRAENCEDYGISYQPLL